MTAFDLINLLGLMDDAKYLALVRQHRCRFVSTSSSSCTLPANAAEALLDALIASLVA